MFKVKTVLQQLLEEKEKNKKILYRLEKALSDLDYLAMMCDIRLEEETNEEV